MMPKLKYIVPAAIVLGVVASAMIYLRGEAAIQDSAAREQRQSRQLDAARAEQQRLSGFLSRATNSPGADYLDELAKLRAKAAALRKQTNELARQAALHTPVSTSRAAARREEHSPEYWEEWRKAQGTKQQEAARLALVMSEYASDHQNRFPSNFNQVDSYLAKRQFTFSGTNRFEIVYQGSTETLDGISWGSIAIVRDTQSWPTPDGKQARVYGLMGGGGVTITSDDNFHSWEAEHVISPPTR